MGVQGITNGQVVIGFVAAGQQEQVAFLVVADQDGKGAKSAVAVPQHWHEELALLETVDRHVAHDTREGYRRFPLLLAPLGLPEVHQRIDIAGIGRLVSVRDAQGLGVFDFS